PLERRSGTIRVRPQAGNSPIHLVSQSTFRLRDIDGDTHSFRLDISTDLTEECQSVDANGRAAFRLGVRKFAFDVNIDGEKQHRSSELDTVIENIGRMAMLYTEDRRGVVSGRHVDIVGAPSDLQSTLRHFADQITESLDAAAVPIPDGEIELQPDATWQAQRIVPVETPESRTLAPLNVTYTFRGVRPYSRGELAVVELTGTVRGSQRGPGLITGQARGTAQLDAKTGRVMRAQVVLDAGLELSFRGHSVKSSGKLEVRLSRDR